MDPFKRIPVREQDAQERAKNFEEVCLGYNKEEAMEEASRCINCKNASLKRRRAKIRIVMIIVKTKYFGLTIFAFFFSTLEPIRFLGKFIGFLLFDFLELEFFFFLSIYFTISCFLYYLRI